MVVYGKVEHGVKCSCSPLEGRRRRGWTAHVTLARNLLVRRTMARRRRKF